MKALVYTQYGPPDVVSLAEVPKPAPRAHEILIRVHATTVSAGDWRARSLQMPSGFGLLGRLFFGVFGPRKPILGTELAGVVEAVGDAVTRFRVGDAVFAFAGAAYGCHAEYRTMPEDGLVAHKPARLSFEQAAALSFGGTTALCFLRDKGHVKRGEKVLVVGASGAVGSAAVQLARHLGAEVSGVCSTANVPLVRSLGAHAIDYTRDDFAKGGARYDVIVDTTGTAPFSRCEGVLAPGGRLLVVQGTLAQALGFDRPSRESGKKVVAGVPVPRPEDLRYLAELAEAGELEPLIERCYPFEDAAEAHARVDSGHKRGSVVLTLAA